MEKKIVIAGAGVMGASLAQVYAGKGYAVTLYDISQQMITKACELVTINQQTLVKNEMLTQMESDDLIARIQYTDEKSCFATTPLLLESIIEKLDIKQSFWREASEIAPDDAILMTNTSGLHITDIAKAVKNSARFAGQHWLNPPHLIPLCEIIRGENTSDETISTIFGLTEALDKKPVIVNKDISGFIINRLQFSVLREALHIVESGVASMEDVDKVMKYGLGMRYSCLGPFETADLGGLDTFDNISNYLFADLCDAKERSPLLHSIVEAGNLGVKNGKGFYDYSDGKAELAIKRRDEMFIKLAKALYFE